MNLNTSVSSTWSEHWFIADAAHWAIDCERRGTDTAFAIMRPTGASIFHCVGRSVNDDGKADEEHGQQEIIHRQRVVEKRWPRGTP
jgi:hypothetical protein